MPTADRGYIMLDIVLGLFIFGMGFAAVWGLNTAAVIGSAQLDSSLKAINLASSTVDELYCRFGDDRAYIDYYCSVEVNDRVERFDRSITAQWETMDLLLLTVEIRWLERGVSKDYSLESYYYAHSD